VVGDNVNRKRSTFKIMSPSLKGFKDSQKFLVVDIVVEFGRSECTGVKSNRVEFAIDPRG
jgi:hypothetical protein